MDNARLYKQISLEIINAIENNNIDILNELFEKRQNILNNSEKINKLKDDLIKSEILEIDNKIKTLLSKEIEKTKSEIKEHRRSIMVNNSYIQNNKEITPYIYVVRNTWPSIQKINNKNDKDVVKLRRVQNENKY